MHQDPRLAGARAGQDEHVGLLAVVRHDALLHGVVQAADNGGVGFRSGLALDLPPSPGQPALQKFLLFHGEVIHGQPQRLADRLQAALGELHHDVNLQHLSLVVQGQRLEVGVDEAAPLLRQPDGHGWAKNRQTAVQADDLQVVQPQQGVVQEFGGVPDPVVDEHVALERLEEAAHGGLGQQVGAAALRRQLGDQVLQQALGGAATQVCGFLQGTPAPLQGHGVGHTGVAQPLGRGAQMQRQALSFLLLRRRLLQVGNQGVFQLRGLLEASQGVALDALVDEGGQGHVVARDAQRFEVVQGAPYPFGAQARAAHELVGGDAAVHRRLHQGAGDGQQFLAARLVQLGLLQFLLCFFNGLDAQRRWKDLGAVFLAAQQVALFQPGHRGLHPRVVGGGVSREGVVLVFPEDFADGGDDLVVQLLLAVEVAQRPEDTVNFPLAEARAGRQAELRLHVVPGIEEKAARRFPVASGAAGFLQVVLQGGRDVGVNDQPHVGLVDAHAEGVGGGDDFQLPVDEALLHVLPGVWSEAGMEVIGADVLVSQELRYLLGAMAAGAVDDGAAGLVGRQIGGQQVVNEGELLAARRRDDLEAQVVARRAAVEDVELDAESFLEVLDDLRDDRGLGGGSQAQDGGNLAVSGLVADEAADVAVVRPKVLAPFGQAVRLVENPAADLPLLQGLSQGAVAQLLGRDEHDAGVAQAHLVEGVPSFPAWTAGR